MLQKHYEGTSKIINLSTAIGRLLGIVDAANLRKPVTQLRKRNRIKTIHSSLQIEGNTLSLEQVSDLIEDKRVFGPPKDILEVQNAIKAYSEIGRFDAFQQIDYKRAHQILMQGLVENAGNYRTQSVGIFKDEQVTHIAPPAWNVDHLMSNLFQYLEEGADNLIIKSCVFHYEMEFIHPFMDGNGRMGRLWQSVILMRENPIFEFLPIESGVRARQAAYYDALSQSDKEGLATKFLEYMLEIIQDSLQKMIDSQRGQMKDTDRLTYFLEQWQQHDFSRRDYMEMFRNISGATASRDLKKGVDSGLFVKFGELRNTRYQIPKN